VVFKKQTVKSGTIFLKETLKVTIMHQNVAALFLWEYVYKKGGWIDRKL
jgi:hypothetical protein